MIDKDDLMHLHKQGYDINEIAGWADRALGVFTQSQLSKEANYVADLIEQIRDECEFFDIYDEE